MGARMTVKAKPSAVEAAEGEPAARIASPSEQMIADATKPATLKDPKGRTLTVRKPGILAQYRLVEAMGEEASNQTLMNMVMPLIYLSNIDGEDVQVPASKREVYALIQRLDDDGMAVVMGWYVQNIVAPTMAAMKDAEGKAALKN